MYSSYAVRIQLSVKTIRAQIVAPVLVSDNLAAIWCSNNDFVCFLVPSEVCAVPVGVLSLHKLNSYLIIDTAADLWSNRMIKYIGRVPHLPIGNKPFVSFLFYDFSSLSFILHWAHISSWPAMWKCRNVHDGFRQTKELSLYARVNQFFHFLRE